MMMFNFIKNFSYARDTIDYSKPFFNRLAVAATQHPRMLIQFGRPIA